jgi:hypothetical protein
MYIQKLGGSWLKHPFFRSSFLLTNSEDIKSILEAGITDVWIDEEKGDALQNTVTLMPSPTQESPENPIETSQATENQSVVESSMEDDINRAPGSAKQLIRRQLYR